MLAEKFRKNLDEFKSLSYQKKDSMLVLKIQII